MRKITDSMAPSRERMLAEFYSNRKPEMKRERIRGGGKWFDSEYHGPRTEGDRFADAIVDMAADLARD